MPTELLIENLPNLPESFAVQISQNDQRFTAICCDATGRVFVAWHDTNLNVVICELVSDPATGAAKLTYRAGPVPGAKDSCVGICVAVDGAIDVVYGARPVGDTTGPFPLQFERCVVPGVLSVSGVLAGLQQQIAALGSSGDDSALQARVGAVEQRLERAGAALAG